MFNFFINLLKINKNLTKFVSLNFLCMFIIKNLLTQTPIKLHVIKAAHKLNNAARKRSQIRDELIRVG